MPPVLPSGLEAFVDHVVPDPAASAACSAPSTPAPPCASTTAWPARPTSLTRQPSRYRLIHQRGLAWSTTAPFGRTGVQVSPLTLGAMNFGAWGNPDHEEASGSSTGPSTPASTSSTPPTSTRTASRRRSSARRCRGPARRRLPRHQVPRPSRRRPQPPRQLPPLDRPGGREQPAPAWAPTTSTSTRCTAPSRTPTSTRPSARCPTWCTPGQDPLHRHLDLPAVADRRGAVDRRSGGAASGRSPSSRRTRSWPAGSSARCCPSPSGTASACCPWSPLAGGWLSGRYQPGLDTGGRLRRAARLPARYDPTSPANAGQARGRRRSCRSWPTRPGCR